MNERAPHEYEPLRFYDRAHRHGRCRYCVLPRDEHPVKGWRQARAIGDGKYYPASVGPA